MRRRAAWAIAMTRESVAGAPPTPPPGIGGVLPWCMRDGELPGARGVGGARVSLTRARRGAVGDWAPDRRMDDPQLARRGGAVLGAAAGEGL